MTQPTARASACVLLALLPAPALAMTAEEFAAACLAPAESHAEIAGRFADLGFEAVTGEVPDAFAVPVGDAHVVSTLGADLGYAAPAPDEAALRSVLDAGAMTRADGAAWARATAERMIGNGWIGTRASLLAGPAGAVEVAFVPEDMIVDGLEVWKAPASCRWSATAEAAFAPPDGLTSPFEADALERLGLRRTEAAAVDVAGLDAPTRMEVTTLDAAGLSELLGEPIGTTHVVWASGGASPTTEDAP